MQYKKWLAGIPWCCLTHLYIAAGIGHGPEQKLANTPMGSIQLFCKVFLKYITPICLCLVYGCYCITMVESVTTGTQRLKYLLFGPSQKIIGQLFGYRKKV